MTGCSFVCIPSRNERRRKVRSIKGIRAGGFEGEDVLGRFKNVLEKTWAFKKERWLVETFKLLRRFAVHDEVRPQVRRVL